MSRIGKSPIELPKGVELKVEGNKVTVKGTKGTLTRDLPAGISITVEGTNVVVKRAKETNDLKALHGLYRMLMKNMIDGVSKGFERKLELSGVGYRAAMTGTKLTLQVGYSHPVIFNAPAGITFKVEGQDKVLVSGFDKELVGLTASRIRASKEVEPYKLKGIKYAGEYIKKKAGKAAKTAGAAK